MVEDLGQFSSILTSIDFEYQRLIKLRSILNKESKKSENKRKFYFVFTDTIQKISIKTLRKMVDENIKNLENEKERIITLKNNILY